MDICLFVGVNVVGGIYDCAMHRIVYGTVGQFKGVFVFLT